MQLLSLPRSLMSVIDKNIELTVVGLIAATFVVLGARVYLEKSVMSDVAVKPEHLRTASECEKRELLPIAEAGTVISPNRLLEAIRRCETLKEEAARAMGASDGTVTAKDQADALRSRDGKAPETR